MFWPRLSVPFRIETLVYQFTGPVDHPWFELSPEFRWVPACGLSVRRLFDDDAARSRKFLQFLQSGCFGYFLERGGQWITYGWCTQPRTMPPPHLPLWAGDLGAYWIFYCHTREEFREQGHYKRLLARLVAGAHERASHPQVLCDTLPENFASRNAVLQSGFVPSGVVTAYGPGGGLIFGGSWRRNQPHEPRIEPSSNSGQRAA